MEPACRCNCDLFVYHRYCCEYCLCDGSVSGCYLPARPSKPAYPSKTDFRGSHHLVFGDTRWWRVCGSYLLGHAPFTAESINPRNPTGRLRYPVTTGPQDAAGQCELTECQLWEERPQEGFVPFQYDGVIPSNPRIVFSDTIQTPVIVSIIDATGNIHEGEVAIPPLPLSRLLVKTIPPLLRC